MLTTRRATEQKQLENKNGEEKHCMDIKEKHCMDIKGNLMMETESLLIAAQNNAIRTNYIKARIDKIDK